MIGLHVQACLDPYHHPKGELHHTRRFQYRGKDLSKVLYFSVNNIDEADIVTVYLRKKASLKKDKFEQDFGDLIIKGRDSKGNIVTKDSIRKVSYKSKGSITEKDKKIDDIEVQDEQQVSDENDEAQTKLDF